jgi:hypothetical protein
VYGYDPRMTAPRVGGRLQSETRTKAGGTVTVRAISILRAS